MKIRKGGMLLTAPERFGYKAKHFLLFFPEEAELTEQKAIKQQQNLIGRKNGKYVCHRFEPHRRMLIEADEMEKRLSQKHHRHAGKAEHHQHQHHLHQAVEPPLHF